MIDGKNRRRKNNPEDLVDIKRNPRFLELEERYIETYQIYLHEVTEASQSNPR